MTSRSFMRLVETFWKNMCLVARIPLYQNHIYAVLPPTPCIFGTVSQSYLRFCLPASSLHSTPNKTTPNSHLVFVFFLNHRPHGKCWHSLNYWGPWRSFSRLEVTAQPRLTSQSWWCHDHPQEPTGSPVIGCGALPGWNLALVMGLSVDWKQNLKMRIITGHASKKGDYNFCHLEQMSYQPFKSSSQVPH